MARTCVAVACVALLGLAPGAGAQAPAELVKDIAAGFQAPDPSSSWLGGEANPTGIVSLGALAFFQATPTDEPGELWRTDGSDAGTALVKTPAYLPAALGGRLLFVSYEDATGLELWRVEGLGAPERVADLWPGPGSSAPSSFAVVGGIAYFAADDGVHGRELWRSDGSEAGTTLVGDLAPGPASSSPASLVDANGTLYFTASDGATGSELWRSDGSAAGTALVKDIRAGASGSSIALLTGHGNAVFFTAYDGAVTELWTSDGTEAGTLRLDPAPPSITQLAASGGTLFIAARELWKSDGTPGGTVRVLVSSDASNLTDWAGTLYFVNAGGLWRSDGTATGTTSVRTGLMGPGTIRPNLRVAQGRLWLAARTSATGYELWKSDGSFAGTVPVADIFPGSASSEPGPVAAWNGGVLFAADDGVHGNELWRSDGSAAGTSLVKDVEPPRPLGSVPTGFVRAGPKVFFAATDPDAGSELWSSDGTNAGTERLDLRAGAAGSDPTILAPFSDDVLFNANDGSGAALWRSDGTPAGSVRLGPAASSNSAPGVANGLAFFTTSSASDLWATDGTAAGTRLVHPVDVASYNAFAVVGSTVFFAGSDPAGVGGGYELWRSDGTALGTVRVKDIRPGSASSSPAGFAVLDGIVYFSADDGTHGLELWRSDGSEAGTSLVTDLRPGPSGAFSGDGLIANPTAKVAYDGAVYFSANDGVRGFEVWRSDGSEAGTTLLKEIPAPTPTAGLASVQGGFTLANGLLFFLVVEDPNNLPDPSLWRTNGSEAGTVALTAPFPRVFPTYPLLESEGKLFFGACTGGAGCEPWTSDGTAAGTLRVADVYPGPRSSFIAVDYASSAAPLAPGTLFSARGAEVGAELWALPPDAVPDSDADGLYDVSEAALGTRSDLADSDADGLGDADEVNLHGTSPVAADSDGDGFFDGAELAAGSDPLDPLSLPPRSPAVPALGAWGSALLASALAAGALASLRRRLVA